MRPVSLTVRRRRAQGLSLLVVAPLIGCSAQQTDTSLSPSQIDLRKANDRFDQTILEGAGTGALAGGLAGGLLGVALGQKGQKLQSAGIGAGAGALAGGLIGAALGYDQARRNYAASKTDSNLQAMLAEANADAAAYRRSAEDSRQIADEARAKIALLDGQFNAKSITADQYRQATASYRGSDKIITDQLTQIQPKLAALQADADTQFGDTRSKLRDDARTIEDARDALARAHKVLVDALARVPA